VSTAEHRDSKHTPALGRTAERHSTRGRLRRALAVTLLLAVSGSALAAQRLRGEILLPDSISPAAHVIVIATDVTGADLAKTTSNDTGAFDLLLPHSGPYRVRVLRLGFRPTLLAPVEVAAGQVRTLRIVLTGSIVSLAQVRVRSQSVCGTGVREESGQLVADLWQQARFALLSTEIPAAGLPMETTAISYERTLDPLGVSVRAESSTVVRAATSRLFASLPADSLARVGYVSEDKTGVVYRAPDARVLLSESFVALHCFAAAPPPEAHPNWVGLTVTPAKVRANISDIDGTLWVDRASAELRLFEYRYTGIPEEVAKAGAGGHIEFARLPNGEWIVSRWDVRMPRSVMTRSTEGLGTWARTVMRRSVADIHLQGGEVLEVKRAGVALYRSVGAAETVAQASAPKPAAGAPGAPATAPLAASVPAHPIGETVLRGRIVEYGDTATSIASAEIELIGTALRRFANSDGRYEFRDIEPGSYQMRVRRLGYLASSERVVVDTGRTLSHDVALKRPTNMLSTVQIQGRAVKVPARFEDVYRRGALSFGRFFTKEDIDRLKPLDTESLFYNVSGVHVHDRGLEFIRCEGGENVQVYVDGVQLTQPNTFRNSMAYSKLSPGAQESLDESFTDAHQILRDISPTSIQAMEVYTGVAQIPAEFLANACAVIAIWTKSY